MGTDYISLIIVSAILGMIAVFCFLTAYRHHKEKGFIFTNRWLFASPKEREQMGDKVKKAEYRVGRNVFILVGFMFIGIAAYTIIHLSWILIVVYVIVAIAVFYGLVYLVRLIKST